MTSDKNHIQDLAEIRAIMQRSTKFFSLSGLAGVSAGVFALIGAAVVYYQFGFSPDALQYQPDPTLGERLF